MTVLSLALVAAGGAIGAVARYLAAVSWGAGAATTFAVNVSGSLLIGVVAGSSIGQDERWRLFLATGVLGGYTTFSTLALESLMTARGGAWTTAMFNLVASGVAGLAAAAAGLWIGAKVPAA